MQYIYFATIQEYIDGVEARPYAFGKTGMRRIYGYGKHPGGERPTVSKEVFARNGIERDFEMAPMMIAGGPSSGPRRGILSAIAATGMFSNNPQIARDSMAYTAMTEINEFHTNQSIAGRMQRLQQEYDAVCDDWHEYFHGPKLRESELDADLARAELIGRAQADAMWKRMEELRAGR